MDEGWLRAPLSLAGKRIWVAGHAGMVGSAVCRALAGESCEVLMVSRDRLDLREQADVRAWMKAHRPDVIVLAAARVGGIGANAAYPADFYHDNLMISANVIHGAYACGVEKLLFLGSSCIYPKDADLPIAPDALLRGVLEPTNEAYALAKIAGLKMAQAYRAQHGCDFISAMPCNLYGPGDRYDLRGSHVIPALMMKAHEAARRGDDVLSVWGSGAPLREFLYVDDLAAALVFLLKYYSGSAPVNVGSGDEISIGDLARKVADVVGFRGGLVFDCSQPDGVYRKVMDSSVIKKAGWLPQISLDCGLGLAYADFCQMAFGEIKTAAVAES